MALDAGVLSVTIEFAKDLKDVEWFGRQDPYCIVRMGEQTFRTKTAVDGGRSPVWDETFQFDIIDENDAMIEVRDDELGRDDVIGTASFSLTRAREAGSERIQVPLYGKKEKQQGFVTVNLNWAPKRDVYKNMAPASYSQQAQPYQQAYLEQPEPYLKPYPEQPQPYPQQYAMPRYQGGEETTEATEYMEVPSQQGGRREVYYYEEVRYRDTE